jgi:hypothetical protein
MGLATGRVQRPWTAFHWQGRWQVAAAATSRGRSCQWVSTVTLEVSGRHCQLEVEGPRAGGRATALNAGCARSLRPIWREFMIS